MTIGELQVQLFILLGKLFDVATIPPTGVINIVAQLFDVILEAVVFDDQLLHLLRCLLLRLLL